MTGNELFEEYCNEYPLIQGYREVNYESWLQQQVVEYRTQVVNKNDLLPDVSKQRELLVCSCGSIKVQTTGGSQCPNNRCSSAN